MVISTGIWRLALVGGEASEFFRLREALRMLDEPFELTQYADIEEARASGIEPSQLARITLPNWAGSESGAALLSVSGPVPESLAQVVWGVRSSDKTSVTTGTVGMTDEAKPNRIR